VLAVVVFPLAVVSSGQISPVHRNFFASTDQTVRAILLANATGIFGFLPGIRASHNPAVTDLSPSQLNCDIAAIISNRRMSNWPSSRRAPAAPCRLRNAVAGRARPGREISAAFTFAGDDGLHRKRRYRTDSRRRLLLSAVLYE
jgi:hypothetical protein